MKKVMEFIEWVSQYNKTLVVPTVGFLLYLVAELGVTPEMTVEQAITLLVGVIMSAVWAVPNTKK